MEIDWLLRNHCRGLFLYKALLGKAYRKTGLSKIANFGTGWRRGLPWGGFILANKDTFFAKEVLHIQFPLHYNRGKVRMEALCEMWI